MPVAIRSDTEAARISANGAALRTSVYARIGLAFALAGLATSAAAAATPTITSLKLLTPKVNVASTAASPVFLAGVTGSGTTISLTYQGPSGEFASQFFSGPQGFPATVVLQGYLPALTSNAYAAVLSPYTEPGQWSVIQLSICDAHFNCSYYDQTQFPNIGFTVVNPDKFDISPPVLVSGKILTPTLSLSRGLPLKILVQATDNVSGIYSASVCVAQSATAKPYCAVSPPPTHRLLNGGVVAVLALPANLPIGSYTVQSVSVGDVAGNFAQNDNPGSIAGLFQSGGGASFTVTP